ncbi:uncharacterized protein LOC116267213 [Nymphaea colorata]|nr:uncharacterized protein LOC116267213 [Nymphaea colorata]
MCFFRKNGTPAALLCLALLPSPIVPFSGLSPHRHPRSLCAGVSSTRKEALALAAVACDRVRRTLLGGETREFRIQWLWIVEDVNIMGACVFWNRGWDSNLCPFEYELPCHSHPYSHI